MNAKDTALTKAKMALIAARERGEPDALTNALRARPADADALVEFDLGLVATSSYGADADAPDVVEIAESARIRAFAAVFGAEVAPTAPAVSLKALIQAHNSTLAALAARLGLGLDVLSALQMGRIRLTTIPQRLYQTLSEALDATVEQVTAAVAFEVAPALRRGQPGAPAGVKNTQIDFADAIITSQSMTSEQRATWLADSAGR